MSCCHARGVLFCPSDSQQVFISSSTGYPFLNVALTHEGRLGRDQDGVLAAAPRWIKLKQSRVPAFPEHRRGQFLVRSYVNNAVSEQGQSTQNHTSLTMVGDDSDEGGDRDEGDDNGCRVMPQPDAEMEAFESELQRDCGWESLDIEEMLQQVLELPTYNRPLPKCVFLLRKCKESVNLEYAKVAFLNLCSVGLDKHSKLGSYLIAMFVECWGFPFAQCIFSKLEQRNKYSWTYMVQGYILNGEPQQALCVFIQMQEDCVQPTVYTFVAVLNACMRLKLPGRGQEIHDQVVEEGYEKNLQVGNALLDFYAQCDMIEEAIDVFNDLESQIQEIFFRSPVIKQDSQIDRTLDGIPQSIVRIIYSLKACSGMCDLERARSLHSQIVKLGVERILYVGNTLVDVYAKCGSLIEARYILDKLPIRDVITWTSMIVGYADRGFYTSAMHCYDNMQEDGVMPNSFTVSCVLKACGYMFARSRGYNLHMDIIKRGFDLDFVVCNALVDMYAKCALLDEAQDLCNKLVFRDVIAWTALMAGYAEFGPLENALSCLYQMQSEGIMPTPATFVCVLKSCTAMKDLSTGQLLHADLVVRGYETLNIVGNCLVGLYAKCGFFYESWMLFDCMPSQDAIAWTTLIEGYIVHGLAKEAFDCLDDMQQSGIAPNAITYDCVLKACRTLGSIDKVHQLHAEIVKNGCERDPVIRRTLVDMYGEFKNVLIL